MGKGDQKSAKGKRFRGSFGVTRPKKSEKPTIAVAKTVAKKKTTATKATTAKASAAKATAAKTTTKKVAKPKKTKDSAEE